MHAAAGAEGGGASAVGAVLRVNRGTWLLERECKMNIDVQQIQLVHQQVVEFPGV